MPMLGRLDTIQETRNTFEGTFAQPYVPFADAQVTTSIPFRLQVTYTDTKLSHRFVRFEVPAEGPSYEATKRKVQGYLSRLQIRRETTGVLLTKLQEDTDLHSQEGD